MRYQADATCLSWIPPAAVEGVFSLPFGLGVAHYDRPPPDELPDVEALLSADAIQIANQLHAWIEVEDGQIVAHRMAGGGRIGSTTMRVAARGLTLRADGPAAAEIAAASRFPRHYLYDSAGHLTYKTAVIRYKDWIRTCNVDATPWGGGGALVPVAAEQAARLDALRRRQPPEEPP